MQNLTIIMLIAIVNIFSSCNRKEAKTVSSKVVNESVVKSDSVLVVSFISKGSGVDKNAINTLKTFIDEYNTNSKKPVTYLVKSWGREGEKDYCINESNKEFIDKVKSAMQSFELVRIKENSTCRQ
jgi:hypothetical protein